MPSVSMVSLLTVFGAVGKLNWRISSGIGPQCTTPEVTFRARVALLVGL